MKVQGRLNNIVVDWKDHMPIVSFKVDAKAADIEKYSGKDLDIEFKQHREKRSLNANAYFHVLVDKIAHAVGRSIQYVKNDLITHYGQPMYIEDEQVIIKSNLPPEVMSEQEILHAGLVRVGIEPKTWFYRIYRGSSTYNTAEMSQLIDATVSQAQELGIETMTPDQIKKMMATYEERYGKEV